MAPGFFPSEMSDELPKEMVETLKMFTPAGRLGDPEELAATLIWLVSANAIWITQVVAIVVGHVIALALAHDRALELERGRGEALRSQAPMLILMVLLTVAGLWSLSAGMAD